MYFSRVIYKSFSDYKKTADFLCKDKYYEHQMLWELFDNNPESKRDFLFRNVIENKQIKYYVLSKRKPVDKSGILLVSSPKKFNPKLSRGQWLFFSLHANPIITQTTSNGKRIRHDVVMHEKKRIGFERLESARKPSLQSIVFNSCFKWLKDRSEENGFLIEEDSVKIDGYRQHATNKKSNGNPVQFSTVDFEGLLKVDDPVKFKSMLFNGIGKSKAFGCGLMLIRRA